MVRKNITGAGYGINSWLQQRVTAIIMLICLIVFFAFVFTLASDVNATISSWQGVFACVWVKIFVQIFVIALLLHAWVGIRDIWMDYVQIIWLKLTLHSLTILWLLGSLIYSIKVLWL